MSTTKSDMIDKIDTNLADFSDIVPSEHREVEEMFVDEFYGIEKREYNASGTNTILNATPAVSGVTYNLYFKKVGNTVSVQGSLTNGSGGNISGNTTLFNVINSEYEKLTGSYGFLFGIINTTGAYSAIYLSGSTIKCDSSGILAGVTVVINGKYTVADN